MNIQSIIVLLITNLKTMKIKLLALLCLSVILISCGGNSEDIIPADTVGKSTTVITGAVSTTLEYEAEFQSTISTIDIGLSSLSLNMGNIGQTESAVIITLGEFGNKQGFGPGTYNFDNDPEPKLLFNGYYVNADNGYYLNSASSLPNKIVIISSTDTKIIGEYELNLEGGPLFTEKIKLVGTFEAVGETFRQ